MFFATDPLEQFAATLPLVREAVAADALAFAASWRHGMAGNSWIYMPGFFATAAALWLHARRVAPHRRLAGRIAAGVVGAIVAIAANPVGSSLVVRSFEERTGVPVPAITAYASPTALFNGMYTLLTWSVFVLACRIALIRHTLRPFVAAAVLSAGLAALRPWTVDDFAGYWAAGVASGRMAAWLSFALIFLVALLLASSEWRSAQPQPGESVLYEGDPACAQDQQ